MTSLSKTPPLVSNENIIVSNVIIRGTTERRLLTGSGGAGSEDETRFLDRDYGTVIISFIVPEADWKN